MAANRSDSRRSRTNARTTRTPAICSRSTRLMASIRFCMDRKYGIIRVTIRAMTIASTGTATSSTADSPTSSRIAMMTPPTSRIGAMSIIVNVSSTTICTCCTSFVVRVISVGAPNVATSCAENVCTCPNSRLRTSRPNAIAVLAPK